MGDALERGVKMREPARDCRVAIHRFKQYRANTKAKGGFCVVHFRAKEAGLKQLRHLRDQLDRKEWQGAVAVVSRNLANDKECQRILLARGRTHALRILLDSEAFKNPRPLVENLFDLIDTVEGEDKAGETPGRAEPRKHLHPPYLEASRPIRNPESQRLDAKKVAEYFDLSLRKVARVLGKSHATIDKTPDSKNLQGALQPFEAILRGRILVNNNDALFRQWLNTANEEMPEEDGKRPTPMEIIRMGHPEVVAGLVDEALTGEPT